MQLLFSCYKFKIQGICTNNNLQCKFFVKKNLPKIIAGSPLCLYNVLISFFQYEKIFSYKKISAPIQDKKNKNFISAQCSLIYDVEEEQIKKTAYTFTLIFKEKFQLYPTGLYKRNKSFKFFFLFSFCIKYNK